MITPTKWLRIPATALIASGTPEGTLGVSLPHLFKVGMVTQLFSATQTAVNVRIKRIDGGTFSVGGVATDIHDRLDISAYLVGDGATLNALEQERPAIPPDDVIRHVYEEDPAVALRSFLVDQQGEAVGNAANPLNISGSFSSTTAPKYEDLLALLTNANWLVLADYEAIIPLFSGNLITLQYFQNSNLIARAIYRFVNATDWDLTLEHYINEDDGSILQDDDDSELFVD